MSVFAGAGSTLCPTAAPALAPRPPRWGAGWGHPHRSLDLAELVAVAEDEVHVLIEGLERADEDAAILQDAPHAVVDVLQHLAALPHRLQESAALPAARPGGEAERSSLHRCTRGPRPAGPPGSPWLRLSVLPPPLLPLPPRSLAPRTPLAPAEAPTRGGRDFRPRCAGPARSGAPRPRFPGRGAPGGGGCAELRGPALAAGAEGAERGRGAAAEPRASPSGCPA